MEQSVRRGRQSEIPIDVYQLGEAHQLGQPLALYHIRPQVRRKIIVAARFNVIIALGVFLAGLIALAYVFFSLQALNSQHPASVYQELVREADISHLQNELIESLLPVALGLIGSVTGIVALWMIARLLPTSLLICSEGFLLIRPARIDVTHWSEVKGLHPLPRTAGGKDSPRYRLSRINQKPLILSEAFEDVEDLVEQIRQQLVEHRRRDKHRSTSTSTS